MKRKLEPIEMFCETVLSQGKVKGMMGGHFTIHEDTGAAYRISSKMALELAREAWLYKQFYLAQSRMAHLVDSERHGFHVAPIILEQAKDEFVKAKNACHKLQINNTFTNVEVDNGSPNSDK